MKKLGILLLMALGCTPYTQHASLQTPLALYYLQKGQLEIAKAKLLLADKAKDNSPQLAYGWGYYYELTGNMNQANNFYKKAIRLDPNSGAAHNNWGIFLCHRKAYPQAFEQFIQAAHQYNYLHSAEAYKNAASCALSIPDFEATCKFLNKSLKFEKINPYIQERLTKCCELKSQACLQALLLSTPKR